ncbi:beta-lactamase [Russula earlei]|uniref:Beta-lactamase n=1 Tax=Russula earlei TaxID=71964 RepID=A0ACC0TS27_9AGAM|nr:beta-lactamase [Russula earlei]
MTTKASLPTILLAMLFLLNSYSSLAQKLIPPPVMQEVWSKPYDPFRIAGNLYYVGTYDLGCYLITTPKGHILINTGLAESMPVIRSHIETLGFKFSDIKILLTTQVHFDHVGAMAAIQKATGAKMMVDEKDAPVLADGGYSDYIMGGKGKLFVPVKADRLLHDHDTITLGGTQVILLHHPGHTKGSCSFLVDVQDEHRSYRVLIANMPSILDDTKPGMPAYPEVAGDYAYTFNAMKHLQFDIWVASHASQFDLQQKRKPGDPYNPEVFNDRKGYDAELDELYQSYLKRFPN